MVAEILGSQWNDNYIANKEEILKAVPFFPDTQGAYKAVPRAAMVVGAGPSLFKNIGDIDPTLYDVVACDKTVPRLVRRGVFPKYIVALNAAKTEVDEWIAPANDPDVTLIMPCVVHPDTYKGWRGEKVFINNTLPTNLHQRIAVETSHDAVTIGSNAGTFALIMALSTGHQPVGCVGLDFSFLSRAEILHKQASNNYNILEMTDVNGDVRYSDIGWFSMSEAFQEYAKAYGEWFGLQVANCTEGGINYSPFVRQMTLKEFNDSLNHKPMRGVGMWENREQREQ